MPQFSVNPNRFDPYKQYKFRVKWDGRYIPGICQCSGLSRRTEVVTHREGGDPSAVHKSPGQTLYEPIVLVRGRTHDDSFEKWANKVWTFGGGLGSEVSLADFRKDILIELYNEAGQLVMAFKVYRCWPSEYVALGDLDANDTCVAYESITLEHEGWERDTSVTEPEEPSIK
jgi:phage tail-like protein